MADAIGGLLKKNGLPDTPTSRAVYGKMLEPTQEPKRKWVGLTAEETSGFTQHEMTVVKYVSKVLQELNT
jgi:hypothetical protein